MSDGSFYQILGVSPSASADEIKSAYRELVKRHHPDLFSTAADKEKATEKLRVINEAYRVLGNPKRRQNYDRKFIQKPKESVRNATAARRGTARPSGQRNRRRGREKIKNLKRRLRFSKKQAAYAGLAAGIVLIAFYATRSEPRLVVSYTLFEKLEISSPNQASPPQEVSHDWTAAGQYASVAQCAEGLRQRVRSDEQEGSRAVFGEPNGTMAITVLVRNSPPQSPQSSISPVNPDQSSNNAASQREQKPEESFRFTEGQMSKRVRSLECRAAERLISESWLQRLWP